MAHVQLSLFSRSQTAAMRDCTKKRNYSPENEAFRLDHEARRRVGLRHRHAWKLCRLHGCSRLCFEVGIHDQFDAIPPLIWNPEFTVTRPDRGGSGSGEPAVSHRSPDGQDLTAPAKRAASAVPERVPASTATQPACQPEPAAQPPAAAKPESAVPARPAAPTWLPAPTRPTNPTCSDTPGHPTNPTRPDTPTRPTNPTRPNSPTRPTTPTRPAVPAEPVALNLRSMLAAVSHPRRQATPSTVHVRCINQTGEPPCRVRVPARTAFCPRRRRRTAVLAPATAPFVAAPNSSAIAGARRAGRSWCRGRGPPGRRTPVESSNGGIVDIKLRAHSGCVACFRAFSQSRGKGKRRQTHGPFRRARRSDKASATLFGPDPEGGMKPSLESAVFRHLRTDHYQRHTDTEPWRMSNDSEPD